MTKLVGTPSDDAPDILATGRPQMTTVFISMSARHPEGRDAEYLEWHSLDHRPEQYRLAAMQSSLRLVSTAQCRALRASSEEPYDDVDHVMTYLFADKSSLAGFTSLAAALRGAGRMPHLLPAVKRGIYTLKNARTAPRARVGADVLPWWPARGAYLLIERGESPAESLLDVPGVAGLWSMTALQGTSHSNEDDLGLQVTYCLLDEEPCVAAEALGAAVKKRWGEGGVVPLLAAPFHTIVPYDWNRYVP